MHIVDRRLNPSGKNLANRQRFMRRAKSLIRKAVHESSASRSIKDADQAGEVALPAQGVHEPSFHRSASGGMRDHLLPGNKQYIAGRHDPAPAGRRRRRRFRGQSGRRRAGRFPLRPVARRVRRSVPGRPGAAGSREAPRGGRRKRQLASRRLFGHRLAGQPGAAAHGAQQPVAPHRAEAAEARRAAAAARRDRGAQSGRRATRRGASSWKRNSTRKLRRTGLIPYIDPLDVRYRRFEPQPKPVAQAVMFCLMDVSGSMTEHMKDLAKRFYVLLYIFLKRRYKHVDVVFIRHTHQAQEVDEDTFFNSPGDRRHRGVHRARGDAARGRRALQPGLRGTSTRRRRRTATTPPVRQRQDRGAADRRSSCRSASTTPIWRSAATPSISRPASSAATVDLWQTYTAICKTGAPMAMRKVGHRRDIYPVFRELFAKKTGDDGSRDA